MTDFPDTRTLQATAPKDMITRVHRGLEFVLRIAAKWPGAGIKPMCSVPDDHISPRRSALFMARSVLRDIRDGVQPC
jgi:hypothetical protein